MPDIDGYETCRRLKANPELRHIPVVFLTARDELAGVLEGFKVGGVDYITKPFQLAEVEDALVQEAEQKQYLLSLESQLALSEQVIARTRDSYRGRRRLLHQVNIVAFTCQSRRPIPSNVCA